MLPAESKPLFTWLCGPGRRFVDYKHGTQDGKQNAESAARSRGFITSSYERRAGVRRR